MKRHKFLISVRLILVAALALAFGIGQSYAQSSDKSSSKRDQQLKSKGQKPNLKFKGQKPTAAEKKAAAGRAMILGVVPGVAGLATPLAPGTPLPGTEGPGGIPHYFGPYGNWAYSPLPKGAVSAVTIVDGGSGYKTTDIVTIKDAHGTGTGATASIASVDATGKITGITFAGGAGYTAPVVIIDTAAGTGAIVDAVIGGTLTGGLKKFIDPLPGLYDPRSGVPAPAKSIPLGVPDVVTYPGSDYYEIALREYSEKMHSSLPATKLRGYVQVNNGTNTYAVTNPTGCVTAAPIPAGSHLCTAADNTVVPGPIRYLGPIIVAKGTAHNLVDASKNPLDPPKPVRVKFINELATGAGGDLFLPVDETVPGAGVGPSLPGSAGDKYTQNRATIHLHGNNTVWLSDGNTHQWITPAGEATPYPAGVSARNVPDMPGCASNATAPLLPGSSGCMTFYYTNAQSARLQFYHDHAMGITRLNVYAGEAAGYVLTDAVEQDMINGTNFSGVNLTPAKKVLPDIGIPLVIQDRTFVEAATVFAQDPTWNWGTGARNASGNITEAKDGDLWFPHVYMSAQNPYDLSGTNPFGRWHYGPWFNPPVPTCVDLLPLGCIETGPVPNPYADPANPAYGAFEPPEMPGTPNPSIPGEAFMDTPMVNGAVYPYVVVEPKAYRLRILNASNDRFLNLQLYQAADKNSWTPGTGTAAPGTPTALCPASPADPTICTEVKMVSVLGAPNQITDWPSGIPDPTAAGPVWWQIGTEGGFLPEPVEVPQQPVGWSTDATVFNVGNVNQHSLLLGSAERADVVVDFSGFAGQTLILYNDAPAAFPAGVATYDYYTGVANQMDVGGAPTTQPGYGPNTRTIMQIRVGTAVTPGTETPDVNLANLQAVFKKVGSKRGVFEASQDPIIVPQTVYNSAYEKTFPNTATEQFGQIANTSKTFKPIDYNVGTGTWDISPTPITLPLEMKAMHDEMSGVYDTMFGRMSGMLGMSLPTSAVHVLIPYSYASPPTDLVQGSVPGTPVAVLPDGTQIWRIFHNGVDTHTIHTHLFTSQLLNRVSQDGLVMLPPDPEERGWKDTFRINPLEITYLAMRPTIPTPAELPFEAPDSVRLIDPTLPEGATLIPPAPAGWFDPAGVGITEILNHKVNFGWEYVWHCHILAHEEMDMMHSLVFAVPPKAPSGLTATWNGSTTTRAVTLVWTDNSLKEAQFTVQRATNSSFSSGLTTFNVAASTLLAPANVTYIDNTVANNTKYWYRVFAIGTLVGDVQAYPAPSVGFPTMSADSVSTTVASVQVGTAAGLPASPTTLTATLQTGPRVSLRWTDNSSVETGFIVQRCSYVAPATTCTNFAQIAVAPPRATTGTVTYIDTTVAFKTSYRYRVYAVNATGQSASPTNTVTVTVPAIPAAPTNFRVVASVNGTSDSAVLSWASATSPFNFTIERANNLSFTTGLATFTVLGKQLTLTQTVNRNTIYYYRIRANNQYGGSSSKVNALPFPILTP